MWNQLKFVTGNPNKVREAREILGVPLEQVQVDGLHEIQTSNVEELVEHKVRSAWEVLRCPVMVEDSALVFSAWNGLPGALVKWFEESVGCQGMLTMLQPFSNREAKALCLVAAFDGQEILIGKGEVCGTVAREVRGTHGFGWDVLFIPQGHQRTYAEMPPEEKNAISHRRLAFEALKPQMKSG